jgi:hypothetical protein
MVGDRPQATQHEVDMSLEVPQALESRGRLWILGSILALLANLDGPLGSDTLSALVPILAGRLEIGAVEVRSLKPGEGIGKHRESEGFSEHSQWRLCGAVGAQKKGFADLESFGEGNGGFSEGNLRISEPVTFSRLTSSDERRRTLLLP